MVCKKKPGLDFKLVSIYNLLQALTVLAELIHHPDEEVSEVNLHCARCNDDIYICALCIS